MNRYSKMNTYNLSKLLQKARGIDPQDWLDEESKEEIQKQIDLKEDAANELADRMRKGEL